MQAKRLPAGGTIGLFCPSHVADMTRYEADITAIKRLGFRVKLSENFEKATNGYAASAQERAADFNALVADASVDMILFNGGNSAVEILPLIDYENVRQHPKLISSYSDATPVLNAIHAQTGLVTYYGTCAGDFRDLRYYNYMQFLAHFMEGYEARGFCQDSPWRVIHGGSCQGTLVGEYTSQFSQLLANRYFNYDTGRKYILFIESHEKFSWVGKVATDLAFIGQSRFMDNVAGLVFGHYATTQPDDFLRLLERFGKEHDIPVVYSDDFGHGAKRAVFPIGMDARLDADGQKMSFLGYNETNEKRSRPSGI
ncbi:MAG: LD-carboxypeptidase [Defluviitaleaceae bacterium]|nr:LD-carboxypeptidase [Defluviitaleaceae bacterium]